MLADSTISRLKSQMSRGELVIFTGAGFSLAAISRKGIHLPSVADLKKQLWEICFPAQQYDPSSLLGDLFAVASHAHPQRLKATLEESLSIDPATLPDFYSLFFNCPWFRWYTLNVDDLPLAAMTRSHFRRNLRIVSATSTAPDDEPRNRDLFALDYIHLNGRLSQPLEQITFSETQFAERIANREPWYTRCVADLLARPVIFIGTELREPPLWQHMELRRRGSRAGRDLRPASILVTPTLDASRQEILRSFRIEWCQGTTESFAREVLARLANEIHSGYVFLEQTARYTGRVNAPLVSEILDAVPRSDTNYLLGDEPQWADLIEGRVVERSNDAALLQLAREILAGSKSRTALAVIGTAGTGKSSSLRGLAMRLSAEGTPVLWIDKESEVSPSRLREQARATSGPLVLAIDDADLFGEQLAVLITDLVASRADLLVVFAARSGQMERLALGVSQLGNVQIAEHVVPNLTDEDIDLLIAHLDKHNRLGVLKGLSDHERRSRFQEQDGRQLLVAMIEVTSGRRFEEKAEDELNELPPTQRFIYALLCLASTFRASLTKDEILLAFGSVTGDALAALETLARRHLITQITGPRYRSRHRVIADIVVAELRKLEQLKYIWIGLLIAMASKVDQYSSHSDRCWRLMVRLLNHARVLDFFGPMQGRDIYNELEGFLRNDYHFWLQRGSLEVERGDVRLADQFIGQAMSLAPDDHLVRTAFGYVSMRKACEYRTFSSARDWFEKGTAILREEITERGGKTPHAVHVFGSQGLTWIRHDSIGETEKHAFLTEAMRYLDQASKQHPLNAEVRQLRHDVEREILMLSTRKSRPPGSADRR